MTQVKDLRKLLRGVKGDAKIRAGNSTAYSPDEFGNVLHIDIYYMKVFHKDKTLPNEQIKTVVLWSPE